MFHGVTFGDKVCSVQSWMSSHFSRHVGSALCPECPGKDWRGKSCWLHPWQSGPEVVQEPVRIITSRTLLGVEPSEVSEISKNREVFQVLVDCCPPRS